MNTSSLRTWLPRLSRGLFIFVASLGLSGCYGFRFEKPLYFLLLLPFLALLYVARLRDPATLLYSRSSALDGIKPTLRIRLRFIPVLAHSLSVFCIVAALARPQTQEFQDESVDGIDIMLAFDMSGSMAAVDMNLTEIRAYQMRHDLNPPNRFDHAQATLKRFVSSRTRDRIGMVIFAKDAYLQFPLTLDYSTIQGLIDQLQLTSIDPSATAIGNALGLSIRGLMDSDAASRTVILITDGKQHGGNISPIHAAEIARDEGVRIFPILVGSGAETLVPIGGLSKRPSRFRPESHPIDPQLLEEIAELTNGAFYRATQPEHLEQGLNQILNELETTRMRDIANVRANELFMHFALMAFIFTLLAGLIDTFWLRRFP